MKTTIPLNSSRRHERGVAAVVLMIAVLSLMLVFIAANIRILNQLETELDLVQQRHRARLKSTPFPPAFASFTNHVSPTVSNQPPVRVEESP